MTRLLRYIVWGIFLIALQTTTIRFFSIEEIMPDVVCLWLVYVALREGQIAGSVAGFIAGLLCDFLSGDALGLSALSKTLCGFIAGYFYDEFKTNQILGTMRFFFSVVFASLFHNVLYFAVYLFGTELTMLRVFLQFGLGTTAYTAAVSLIPSYWKKK